jgi:hypothetical protein
MIIVENCRIFASQPVQYQSVYAQITRWRLVKETIKGQRVYYSLYIQDKPYVSEILKHIPSQKEQLKTLICEDNECCT